MYHYGWVKEPEVMQVKRKEWVSFYDNRKYKIDLQAKSFDYSSVDALEKFEDTHPQVTLERIKRKNWAFEYDTSLKRYTNKERLKRIVYILLGLRIGEYKNYKII